MLESIIKQMNSKVWSLYKGVLFIKVSCEGALFSEKMPAMGTLMGVLLRGLSKKLHKTPNFTKYKLGFGVLGDILIN